MNQEPSAADIQAVNEALTQNTPPSQPVPQPAPQPSEQPVQQPAPQENPQVQTPPPVANQQPNEVVDPFEQFANVQPPAPQPAPTPQPTPAPQAPPQQPTSEYQTFDDYMNSVLDGLPQPNTEIPKVEDINQDDPADIQRFFTELRETIVKETINQVTRQSRIESAERKGWEECFETYPSLRKNSAIRDAVHNVRMGAFNRGIAMSPKQAAKVLLDSFNPSEAYKRGVANSQVVTTIQNNQPNGGGGVEVIPQQPADSLSVAASNGEVALMNALDAAIKSGKI